MKKIFYFAAALALILPSSCNKEIATPEVAPGAKTVKVTMGTIGDAVSKVSLNGNSFEWEEGDQAIFRFSNTTYSDAKMGNVLTASGAGSAVRFTGNISGVSLKADGTVENVYAYYSKNGAFWADNNVYRAHAVANVQTGRMEDLDEHVLYASYIPTSKIKSTKDENNDITSISFNAEMTPYFSIVKINVPQSLNLNRIVMNSATDIAGFILVRPQTEATAIGSGTAQNVNRTSTSTAGSTASIDRDHYKTITIEQGGNVISGDVYFVILPDKFDKVTTKRYYCSAKSLKFTFISGEKTVDYEAKLNDFIFMGDLKDLGEIPANIMDSKLPKVDAGQISLINGDGSYKVTIKDPNESCEYYYEVGSSKGDCPVPTVNSQKLNVDEGLPLSLSASSATYFIRILAHTEDPTCRDVIMTAYLKNWKMNSSCPVGVLLASAHNGTVLTNEGNEIMTSDGLAVYRRLEGDFGFDSSQKHIEATNAVMLNMLTTYITTKTYIHLCCSNFYGISSGKTLGFKLWYNNSSRTSNHNGTANTSYSITREESMTSEDARVVSFSWDLGSMNAHEKVAFIGDGKVMYYNLAMLEVL